MKTKVAIVIPNWNGIDMIASCLQSLQSQSQKADLIVVDNGSTDNSVELIEEKFPDVTVTKLPRNTGFAGGVNTGFKKTIEDGCEFVAAFNNDAVADKDWLQNLIKRMEQDEMIGIVSCKQLRSDGKYIDSTGDNYSIWGMPFPRGRNHEDKGQYDEPEEIFSAPAGATLYRTAMLKEIGLFDEKFFAYLEDVDISFRARLAGWRIFYEPKAVVFHEVSATGSKLGNFSRYHYIKNFFLLYAKNMPGWLYWKYLPLFAVQAVRLAASSLLRGAFLAYVRGMVRAFLLTPHIISQRWRIQKFKKVSSREIDSWLYKKRAPKIPSI